MNNSQIQNHDQQQQYYSNLLNGLFQPAFDQVHRDVELVKDKFRKAKLRVDRKKKELMNENSSSRSNNNHLEDDEDYEEDHLLVEYGCLFGIDGEDDIQARKDEKNKKITNLPQARLPVPEVKAILTEGETFVKVFEKVLTALENDVTSNHDHSQKFVKPTTMATATDVSTPTQDDASNSSSMTNNNNSNTNNIKKPSSAVCARVKSLATKVIGPSPTKFPTLFQHFLGQVNQVLTRTVALATFCDCHGTEDVLLVHQHHRIKNNNTSIIKENNNTSSISEAISLIAPVTRQTAQGLIYSAALEGSKISDTCPRVLVEMVESNNYSQRLADAVIREFERGYRKMVFQERNQQNQGEKNDNDSADVANSNTTSIMGGTDALQAVWSAFQKEQELFSSSSTNNLDNNNNNNDERTARLTAKWLLFVRLQIAPRLLKFASKVIDPLVASADNSSTLDDINNTNGNSSSSSQQQLEVDFYYNNNQSSEDEDIWTTFDRLYSRLLLPSLSSDLIDCDSVRTILYRVLSMFENKVKKTTNSSVFSTSSATSSSSIAKKATSSSSLTNWASFGLSNKKNSSAASVSSTTTNTNTTKKATTMSDLVEDALSRHCSAAVYSASFNSPEGYEIKVAEGDGMPQPIQFYFKDRVEIFAKKGKLKNLATPFYRILSIEDLVKFAKKK